MSSTLRHTVAFRLTAHDRERLDELARADGLSASEFARRAVLRVADVSSKAIEAATQRGRDEMRPQIAQLVEAASQMRSQITRSQASERSLHRRLTQAPEELMVAARQLVDATPRCQVAIVTCWARMDRHDRCKAIPLIATAVAVEADRAVATIGFNETSWEALAELVDRLEWLMTALTPDSGLPLAISADRRRPEWAPLEASVLKIAVRRDVHERRSNERRAEALAADTAKTASDADGASATDGDGVLPATLRAAIEMAVREAVGVTSEATEIRAISAPEVGETTAAASRSSAMSLARSVTSRMTNHPPGLRVRLGETPGRVQRPGSAPGYWDAAGRHRGWPRP